MRLAILGSTRGTDMQAIIDAINKQRLSASIEIVISNKQDAFILERARQAGLKVMFVDPANLSRELYDEELRMLLNQHSIDLIILIGYMRILSSGFVKAWQNKILNIHPSLLPAFAGGMDQDVHQAVLDAGVGETGCTVHYVTDELDAGPIVVQKRCNVLVNDTVESLKQRVQRLEGEALVEAIEHESR